MDGLIFGILRYTAKGTRKQNKAKQPNAIKTNKKQKSKTKQNKTKQKEIVGHDS